MKQDYAVEARDARDLERGVMTGMQNINNT